MSWESEFRSLCADVGFLKIISLPVFESNSLSELDISDILYRIRSVGFTPRESLDVLMRGDISLDVFLSGPSVPVSPDRLEDLFGDRDTR